MGILTHVLYWVSTGMLVPVIVVLLGCCAWVLYLAGDVMMRFSGRRQGRLAREALLKRITGAELRRMDWEQDGLPPASPLRACLEGAQQHGWASHHCERILCAFEQECRCDTESATALLRLGPMLGLMGTLIPMGPALVSLAAGDLSAMATNMQVAFSTTVIGLFIGGVGFVIHLLKRRWHAQDLQALDYLFSLAQMDRETESEGARA